MKVTDRTLRTYKTRAYFQIAVWSNKVEYIYNSYLSMANNDNLEFGRKIDRFDLNEMGVRKIA